MTLLAEISQAPTANFLLEFLLCISFLGNIATVIVGLVNSRRKQLRQVSFAEEFQPKGEYALKADLKEIESRLSSLMSKGEERAIAVHTRLNPVAENVAAIKGSMEAFSQSFDNFTQILLSQHKK